MPKATRRELVLVKIQPTVNVDAAPDGSDAVSVVSVNFNPAEGAELNERRLVDGSMGRNQHVLGGSLVSFALEIELKGSGAAGVAPEYGPLLRAAGLSETIVADTSVTYEPSTASDASPHEFVTIWYYQDGVLRKAINCVTSLSLSAEARKAGILTINVMGHPGAADSDAAIVSPTLDATMPPTFRNASLELDSYAAVVGSFTMDLQNEMPQRPDVNNAEGFAPLAIIDRNVVGTLNPELVSIAAKDWIAKWRASTAMALSIGPVGATAGNRWAVTGPKVQVVTPAFENADGIRRQTLDLAFAKDTGDDEFALVLT